MLLGVVDTCKEGGREVVCGEEAGLIGEIWAPENEEGLEDAQMFAACVETGLTHSTNDCPGGCQWSQG